MFEFWSVATTKTQIDVGRKGVGGDVGMHF
jgi:hypothetical protein